MDTLLLSDDDDDDDDDDDYDDDDDPDVLWGKKKRTRVTKVCTFYALHESMRRVYFASALHHLQGIKRLKKKMLCLIKNPPSEILRQMRVLSD